MTGWAAKTINVMVIELLQAAGVHLGPQQRHHSLLVLGEPYPHRRVELLQRF